MPDFRLDSLRVENFRSISGEWLIPLDAQVVLVHGPNGSGKTSLLSAIELAASGEVGFLRDQETQLPNVLLNRNYPLGRVELRLRSADGSTRVGSFALSRDRITGSEALNGTEKFYFQERCFLPQTALGRLLETYTQTRKQVDTALVRYVKSVIGLDELDSLIDGLHAAGHLARTRSISPSWEVAERDLAAIEVDRDRLARQLTGVENTLRDCVATLRELLDDSFATVFDAELPAVLAAKIPRSDNHESELSRLHALKMRLESVSTAYTVELGTASTPFDPAVQAESAVRAVAAFNKWESEEGKAALDRLNNIRESMFSLPAVDAAHIFDAYQRTQYQAMQETRRRASERQRQAENDQTRSRLESELSKLASALRDAELIAQAVNVPDDVRALIEILEKTIPLVTSDACPVCDQHFAHDHATLRQHLQNKAVDLTKNAEELMRAREEIRLLQIKAKKLIADVEQIPLPTSESTDASHDIFVRELNGLDAVINTGQTLRDELLRSSARTADITSRQASLDVAERHLAAVRAELNISESKVEVLEEVGRLGAALEQKIQEITFEQTRRTRLIDAADAAESSTRQIERIRAELAGVDGRLTASKGALTEANARKKAANELRRKTEQIRSSMINRVFDESLNTLWADIFSRFVPSEPFVPRFRKQTQASRSVDIRLETVLPNDEVSGSPSSVLSYGNTNTAALSLFVALHLSAPGGLPWLIFDDPVQSMDDIHIANFAAVVRQLSYAHNRQIVIAVHQRELFEYLALELAPTSSDESLIKVSLDRQGKVTYIHTERVEHLHEPPLALAPTR